jgi:adenosylcobinamide kinase / adenosylcobinamide-phosphate guanylyltransferase
MNDIILVTGGARSGKSRFALELAKTTTRKAFIATAQPVDDEMRRRIEKHRLERGEGFLTVEEPLDLAGVLGRLDPKTEIAVVDCLTVWLGNLMHIHGPREALYEEGVSFLAALRTPPCRLVIVTNEVGSGLVPENELARCYRDLSGLLNQSVARLAACVVFMVSGVPLTIKTEKGEK